MAGRATPPSLTSCITGRGGPSISALVREVDGRIAPSDREAFEALVNGWTGDPDALLHRLLALRDGIAPPLLPAGRKSGSGARALVPGAIGAVAGAALGFDAAVRPDRGEIVRVSHMEGAFAMGVVIVAAWAARRAWREGDRPGP